MTNKQRAVLLEPGDGENISKELKRLVDNAIYAAAGVLRVDSAAYQFLMATIDQVAIGIDSMRSYEQEPFGYFRPEPFGWTDCAETDEGAVPLYEHPATAFKQADEHKPVAWGVIKRGEGVWFVNDSRFTAQHYANNYAHRDSNGFDQKVVPLYLAPPQREWRGLSQEEIKQCLKAGVDYGWFGVAEAVENKLKEKNS